MTDFHTSLDRAAAKVLGDLTSRMVIAPDWAGEPTVWVENSDKSALVAALQRSDIAPACRGPLWAFLESVIEGRVDAQEEPS